MSAGPTGPDAPLDTSFERSPDPSLRIRRAEPEDFEGIASTLATPKAYGGTLQLPFPSLASWRERLAKPDPDTFLVVAEARAESGSAWEIVGHLGLHPATGSKSPRRRHAITLGVSVRDDRQGRGVGGALMRAALDRADRWMQVLRIEITVYADNEAAIALYRRHGFAVEGTHRAYALRDGVFVDALSMARLHPRQPLLPSS